MTGTEPPDQIATWMGKPVADMTREELIEAVQHLARANRELHKSGSRLIELSTMRTARYLDSIGARR